MSTATSRVNRPIVRAAVSDSAQMTASARRLLADISELAPDIAARAAEIEAARRIPPDLVRRLKSNGVFRLQGRRSAARTIYPDVPRRLAILWTVLTEWRRRARGRRSLAQLPDRELRDIGLTRDDVARECGKPFWRE